MSDNESIETRDRRRGDRKPLDGTVTVQFESQDVQGPGENMSDEGVFFVADAAVRVRVRVDDTEEWRDGEVVRVQAMGEGRLGIAVRFS